MTAVRLVRATFVACVLSFNLFYSPSLAVHLRAAGTASSGAEGARIRQPYQELAGGYNHPPPSLHASFLQKGLLGKLKKIPKKPPPVPDPAAAPAPDFDLPYSVRVEAELVAPERPKTPPSQFPPEDDEQQDIDSAMGGTGSGSFGRSRSTRRRAHNVTPVTVSRWMWASVQGQEGGIQGRGPTKIPIDQPRYRRGPFPMVGAGEGGRAPTVQPAVRITPQQSPASAAPPAAPSAAAAQASQGLSSGMSQEGPDDLSFKEARDRLARLLGGSASSPGVSAPRRRESTARTTAPAGFMTPPFTRGGTAISNPVWSPPSAPRGFQNPQGTFERPGWPSARSSLRAPQPSTTGKEPLRRAASARSPR